MTAPHGPWRVMADELAGTEAERWAAAGDQLKALAEHGYAVVSVAEPDEPGRSEPAGCVGD